MNHRRPSRLRVVLPVATNLLLAASGCRPTASASVLARLGGGDGGIEDLPGVFAVAATLHVQTDDGKDAELVISDGGKELSVAGEFPLSCGEDDVCRASFTLAPGAYSFVVDVTAEDRCGVRASIVTLTTRDDLVDAKLGEPLLLTLDRARSSDDDDDGIDNLHEGLLCGRFDEPETQLRATECLDGREACCTEKPAADNAVEGTAIGFQASSHRLASGDDVDVGAFAIDATEVTWRQVALCVAAGTCLADAADAAARAGLTSTTDLTTPATGLLPVQAAQVCAAFGKRLPTDVEWDFAAAHINATSRRKFPFDAAAGATIGCDAGEDGLAVNYKALGRACPGTPLPVGSYASTTQKRGVNNLPIADLAGNVAEWTLQHTDDSASAVVDADPLTDDDGDGVADDVTAVGVRGGGFGSVGALLENDFPLVIVKGDDADAFAANVARLTEVTGFRCALDVGNDGTPPARRPERACDAP